MKNENKLQGRDLINIGIYCAIYFVIMFAVAMLGLIPHFYPGVISGKILIDGTSVSEQELYDTAHVVSTVFQNPRSQFYNIKAFVRAYNRLPYMAAHELRFFLPVCRSQIAFAFIKT